MKNKNSLEKTNDTDLIKESYERSFDRDFMVAIEKRIPSTITEISAISKALTALQIKPFFPEITAVSKVFAAAQVKPFLPEITTISKALETIQMRPFFPEITAVSKVFAAAQVKPFLPEITAISKAFDALQMRPFFPEITAVSKVFAAAQVKQFLPEITAISKTFEAMQMRPFFPEITAISKAFSALQIKPLFPEIPVINNLIRKSNSLITTYNDIIALNLGLILDINDDDGIIVKTKEIDEDFKNVKKDKISFEFYISLIITLCTFVYSQHSSKKDKQEILKAINNSESKIINEVRKFENVLTMGTYYVVVRPTCGYYHPGSKYKNTKMILYPNQKVRLIKNSGKWIYIEYFNHFSNQHEQTWCKKKYFRLIRNI